ncbi:MULTISPECIES: hypothetical protein [unclassified Streptomyces]|uniref:hypothetical protein n=1 Tax=unclassified Streptomyces TaxID=2593676 RepID=UPI002E2E01E3|nr:hypothetical protein [Streptomyces sp. NBC_01429]
MPETASPSRRGRPLRLVAAFTVLLALAGYTYMQYMTSRGSAPHCVVRGTGAPDGDAPSYSMSPDRAVNAATISAVGTSRGLPERAVTIALATALQESALRNLDYGDRDSLGLFQQRPSKGWGTEAQIQDPVYSAGQFYDHLVKVPGYSRLPLTEAAQRVQRSGFPQAYAKHEPDAALLASALTGRSAASLTCSAPSDGVTGDPAKVRAQLVRAFGSDVLPAGSSAGKSAPGGAGAGDAGDTLSVPVSATAGSAGQRGNSVDASSGSRHGWELAHWAVAQSTALGIDEVSFAGRVWSAKDAAKGWRTAEGSAASSTTEVRIRTAR